MLSIEKFSDLNIDEWIKQGLEKFGYDTMTEIQKMSIPVQLEHSKVLVWSETGSGKTLAYLVPLLDHLCKVAEVRKINRDDGIYCVIFVPIWELCI